MTNSSFVYLIEAQMGVLKIGCSARPETRLKTMAVNSPTPLRLIAVWPGVTADERALHARFDAHRFYNEWFRIEGDLAGFVESVRGKGVARIPDWSDSGPSGSAERKKAGRHSASMKLKALWADPAHREFLADVKARRKRIESRRAKPQSQGEAA